MTTVRDDLADAHLHALRHVAAPGARFTGARRVRIAEVACDAYLAAEPSPPWVRPFGDAPLDVAYRLARHAGTITQEWYETVIAEGMHPLEWVEVVGIVVATVPTVAFARAAGLPTPAIPHAIDGEPHGHEAAELAPATLNWVPVADAVGGFDDTVLAAAREALSALAGSAFMVDAAAVLANFEMMTRVADGTGARFPLEAASNRKPLDDRLGIGTFTSAR